MLPRSLFHLSVLISLVLFSVCWGAPLFAIPSASFELRVGISPPQSEWISYHLKSNIPPKLLKNKNLKDPKVLLEVIRNRSNHLNVDQMTPQIVLELTQLLLFGGEPLKAVEILKQALQKWPNDLNIVHAWARAMIKVGTPTYARVTLKGFVQHMPQSSYTRYLYALSLFLEGPEEPRQLSLSLKQLEELITRDPTYQGVDGVNASQIRRFADELINKLKK